MKDKTIIKLPALTGWSDTKYITFEGGGFKLTWLASYSGRGGRIRRTPKYTEYRIEKLDNIITSIDENIFNGKLDDYKEYYKENPSRSTKSKTSLEKILNKQIDR